MAEGVMGGAIPDCSESFLIFNLNEEMNQKVNNKNKKPGLVAQSVTQAVARRSLDGILDAWDQCCHWFIHEGDRQKARHP